MPVHKAPITVDALSCSDMGRTRCGVANLPLGKETWMGLCDKVDKTWKKWANQTCVFSALSLVASVTPIIFFLKRGTAVCGFIAPGAELVSMILTAVSLNQMTLQAPHDIVKECCTSHSIEGVSVKQRAGSCIGDHVVIIESADGVQQEH